MSPRFDPYAMLKALDGRFVAYVVIGGFARVIHGTEELTRGLDIVPSTKPENIRQLGEALSDLNARREDGGELPARGAPNPGHALVGRDRHEPDRRRAGGSLRYFRFTSLAVHGASGSRTPLLPQDLPSIMSPKAYSRPLRR